MQDGLYFWGQWVADVQTAITKQANDLANPTQLQSTYANLFTLPDTQALRSLLENAEQVDAGGADPYRLIPAKVIDEGETVFTGNATLLSFQNGWKVSLTSALKGLLDRLSDVKLSDLNLYRYNHPWKLEVVNDYATATEGIVYPCIDYGSLTGNIFAQDTLTPGIYLKTLVMVMLQRYNYRAVGDWLNDPLYNRLVLPFTEERPKAYDQDWVTARAARVTVTGIRLFAKKFNELIDYNRDSEPLSNWVDGSLNNYKAERYKYVPDVSMRLHVTAFQKFNVGISFGGVEGILSVEKNGQNVAQQRETVSGYTISKEVQVNLDTFIDCEAGDEIRIRFQAGAFTKIAQYTLLGAIDEQSSFASFEPDANIKQGDIWPVAANMPDLTCTDVLKSLALMMEGTYEVNEVAKTIQLRTLDAVLANHQGVQDLSHCVEEGTEPENAVTLPPLRST